MRAHLSGFALGISVPLRGIHLLANHPRLLRWAAIPFVIGLIVIPFGAFFGISFLSGLLPSLVNQALGVVGFASDSTSFVFLYWFVLVLAWPMALFALLYALFMVTRLIAAPFFEQLAEEVLRLSGAVLDRPFRLGAWFGAAFRMFRLSLVKLIGFGTLGGVLFLLSLMPGLGLLTGFGFLLLIAFDTVDASFEACGMSGRERIDFARVNFAFFSGLAVAIGLAFLVPGLNVVLLPAIIAGSADAVHKLGLRERESKHGSRHDSQTDRKKHR